MDLREVQQAMVPGAEEALKKGISYHDAKDAFGLTMVDVALKQSGNVQRTAARKLGVDPSLVYKIVSGDTLSRLSGRKRKDETEQK